MTHTIILTLTAALGLLWGVIQGAIMVQPGDWGRTGPEDGVRGHRWFRYYHGANIALWAGFAALLRLLYGMEWGVGVAAWVLGSAVLAWELAEVGYAAARWGRCVPETEHVVFPPLVDTTVAGLHVPMLHIARALATTLLLSLGGVLP